jgi:hypothetical protein
MRLALVGATTSFAIAVAVSACESATNLDVVYADASAPTEASAPDAGAGEAAVLAMVSACPCDETAGIGCCIPAVGAPFCTADTTVCVEAKGIHVKCSHPDPLTESACCWHTTQGSAGSFTVAALAGACAAGSSACTIDSDCAGTGETNCSLSTCAGGVTIGACGPTAPACPTP